MDREVAAVDIPIDEFQLALYPGEGVIDRNSLVGGSPLVLDYQIADNAVYSDGKPVTCDDLVLAWAAQSGRLMSRAALRLSMSRE